MTARKKAASATAARAAEPAAVSVAVPVALPATVPVAVHATLLATLVEQLPRHADPERAAGQQAYMKRALPFLGLRVPVVRSLVHAACKHDPCTSAPQFRATVAHLFGSAHYQEHRYAAVSVGTFRGHRAFQTPEVFDTYRELIVTAAWWDITDELSRLFGAMLLSHPEPTEALLRAWAHDENLWLRRVAIIAQLGLGKKTKLPLLFDNLEPSLGSSEFFLRKAIGWALRELGKTDPEATRRYVARNEARLSPLSRREALKNL